MEKVRVDKWLWAVRLFKSRTISTDACKAGKVRLGETTLKPSSTVTVGDIVEVKKDGFNLRYEVLALIEKRVGAPIAVTCYADLTTEEEKNKYAAWFINGKIVAEKRERGTGRPTKRERRDLDEFKMK